MDKFRFFSFAVLPTWLVHVGLVTAYKRFFTDTHGAAFRLAYALELSATFTLGVIIYLARTNHPVRKKAMILVVVGFLAVVDSLLSRLIPSIRAAFDPWHFVVGYSLLSVCLLALVQRHTAKS
ncbi:hypothetical protein H7Y63_01880 [Polaromonas sp.]|nr:hypothetical protein [Candidatus Saccharibacteria bacterium]